MRAAARAGCIEMLTENINIIISYQLLSFICYMLNVYRVYDIVSSHNSRIRLAHRICGVLEYLPFKDFFPY